MSRKQGRYASTKWVAGPGGIGCPCCRVGSKQDAKKGDARIRRRVARKEIESLGDVYGRWEP